MTLSPTYLTPEQRAVVGAPIQDRIFLSGPAGTGKTTAAVERVLHLLENGVQGNQILLLVPQRTLATPYYDALHSPNTPAGGAVSVLTIGGLARRMVDLFWPLVAEEAGFAHPDSPPNFLTLETAQYYMAHLVRPLLAEGYFETVTLERNRLYSQILDNLSKAAVHSFPRTEIGERLKSAWIGDPGQAHIYEDAQICANIFRQYCLDFNLLDFSLQLEVFLQQIWPFPLCRETLFGMYHHLIFDNVEEGTPVTADLLQEWLPHFDSVLLVYDLDAGYRRFLGADPESTAILADFCGVQIQFEDGFVQSEDVASFGSALAKALMNDPHTLRPHPHPLSFKERGDVDEGEKGEEVGEVMGDFALVYPQPGIRFYPDMLDWVTDQIATLINDGTPPGEIVLLAPYLSDALRYALVDRLDRLGIPSRSHRPSRSLREEPATRCMLTLAKLAHPGWGFTPQKSDVTYTLMQAIADMDLVRAQLLTQIVYRKGSLSSFDNIKADVQERITYVMGERYEGLRHWLYDYMAERPEELDHFLSRLFGEVLSQPGYGFHGDYNAGTIAANLVESVGKFRWVAGGPLAAEGVTMGREYLEMVEDGVIAAQYLLPWQTAPEDAVFLAPAYTFLMSNRPVDYQFWLDVGGRGWYERLYQPLTHPFVLSRRWPVGQPWTDIDEAETARDSLRRLSSGLLRRCRRGIFLGLSDLSEQGYEHKGELLRGIDRALRLN
jgi:hypothetical protein